MLLKPKHLWKGFLYRKARGWQHQLQTGRKWRENIHYCFSTGSICLLFLAYRSSLHEQRSQSPRDCMTEVGCYNSNLLHIQKINAVGHLADQSLNTTEVQKDWQQAN